MDDFLILDYEKIIKEYDEQLVSKLRDFGRDYLKFWIPEENNVLSLLNLFFSIVQSGIKKFKVKINRDKFSKEEIQKLENYINKFSNYEIERNNDRFIIQLQSIKKNILEKILNNYFIDLKLKKSKIVKRVNRVHENKNEITLKELRKYYFKKNHKFKFRIYNNEFNKKNFNFVGEIDKYKLGVILNKDIIEQIFFSSDENTEESFLIDNFCNIIKNLPIQEAYEHGSIKLEYLLRKSNIKNKIKGIIGPLVVRNLFANCNKLILNIWEQYVAKNNVEIKINFYDKRLSKNWSNLNKDTQIKIIQDEINKFTDLKNLPKLFSIEKFEYSKLLTLSFNDESFINKSQLFLELEKYLNSKVDSRIEVFYKELIDFNKLRLKNSPQGLV